VILSWDASRRHSRHSPGPRLPPLPQKKPVPLPTPPHGATGRAAVNSFGGDRRACLSCFAASPPAPPAVLPQVEQLLPYSCKTRPASVSTPSRKSVNSGSPISSSSLLMSGSRMGFERAFVGRPRKPAFATTVRRLRVAKITWGIRSQVSGVRCPSSLRPRHPKGSDT